MKAIESSADLKKCLDLKVDDKDSIHRVFYFVPITGKPNMYEMCFGSNSIALAVGANLKEVDEQERLKLFRWLDSHGQSRSTAGGLFENYCYYFLSSGNNTEDSSLPMGAHNFQL